jgi:hypothetical protein
MQTECSADLFGFARVEGRAVVAGFDAPELIEHTVRTLVGQRVFALGLGYEDLVDHDELRHDPTMAVLAGKLSARRKDCAPLAGKSTLNRLERGGAELSSRALMAISWHARISAADMTACFR